MFYQYRTQAAETAEKCRFCPWWPLSLTFDLYLQTRPSEGPNTSSLRIWRTSVQRFPGYFIHNQKSHRQRQKQNLTQFTDADVFFLSEIRVPLKRTGWRGLVLKLATHGRPTGGPLQTAVKTAVVFRRCSDGPCLRPSAMTVARFQKIYLFIGRVICNY